MVACLLAAALATAPPKLVVLQLMNGEGVPASTAQAITEAVVAEVRRQSKAEVLTQREIASILSLEKQKAMLGCDTDACMAELGGALGAERLVAGDMAKLGQSFLLHLRVVDVKKVRVSAQADRRLRGGTIDDVLDVLPAMVAELFPSTQLQAGPTPAVAPEAPLSPPLAQPPPAAAASPQVTPASKRTTGRWAEDPAPLPDDVLDRLYVLTDDHGLVIAIVPFQGFDAPFFAGDGEKLYRQRVVGGGEEAQLAFGRVFWDPRARVGAESSLHVRGGRGTLTCGKRSIPLRVIGPAGKRRILARARFFEAPFRRVPHLLARDDQGYYFLVDAARDPVTGRAEDRPDYRLRWGRKGALGPVALTDTVADGAGLVLVTATGRLVERGGAVEWVSGTGRTALTPLDVRDAAPLIYGELEAYGGRLGTPCDGKFN